MLIPTSKREDVLNMLLSWWTKVTYSTLVNQKLTCAPSHSDFYFERIPDHNFKQEYSRADMYLNLSLI